MARTTIQRPNRVVIDADFMSDALVINIKASYGARGIAVLLALLCAIGKNGYFAQWSNELAADIASQIPGVSVGLVKLVLGSLVDTGYFDRMLFYSNSVLTSHEIQRHYRELKRRSKAEFATQPYWLESEETVGNIVGNKSENCPQKRENCGQKVRNCPQIDKTEAKKTNNLVKNGTKIARKTQTARKSAKLPISPHTPLYSNNNIYISTTTPARALTREEIFSILSEDEAWLREVSGCLGRPGPEISERLKAFRSHCAAYEKNHKDVADAKRHFISWVRQCLEREKKEENGKNRQSNERRSGGGRKRQPLEPDCGLIE